MARGLWRWWETKNGADIWRARVEIELGQWSDLEQSEYERAGLAPAFWDLPLQEDYIASLPEPAAFQMYQAELRFMPTVVIGMIVIGGVIALGYAVYAWLLLS